MIARARRAGRGDAEHEARGRHDAVVGAEHRGAQPVGPVAEVDLRSAGIGNGHGSSARLRTAAGLRGPMPRRAVVVPGAHRAGRCVAGDDRVASRDHEAEGVRSMVTTEEIAAIPLFAALTRTSASALARAAADITPRRRASTPRTRARSARSSPCSRADPAGQAHRRDRARGRRARPGRHLRRGADHAGTASRSASARPSRRASCGSRRATTTRSRPRAPEVAMEVGRLARQRIGGLRLQGIAAEPPPPRAIVVGHRWDAACTRPAALPRPQPDHVRLADAGRAGRGRALGRPAAGRRRLPHDPRGRTARPSSARSLRRVAELLGLPTEPRRRRVRRGHRRRRARRASPPPCTARRRACARS